MSKVHISAFPEHNKPGKWTEPKSVIGMCGALVKDALPIEGFADIRDFKPKSTIGFCAKCFGLAAAPTSLPTWYYVIGPAEKVRRLNSEVSEEM